MQILLRIVCMVRITSPELPPMAVQYRCHVSPAVSRDQFTAGEQVWDSQATVEYSHFQIGCVIVEYDLFNTKCFLQNLIYIRFGIILTQFYINFSIHQEHQIDVLCVSFNAWDSHVSSYTPSHFSCTVPVRLKCMGVCTV